MAVYYDTEGWLLRRTPRAEADIIATFFTKDFGCVAGIAAGVRLEKSKLRGHLTLFSRVRLIITPGRGYWRIVDAAVLQRVPAEPEFYSRCARFVKFFLPLMTHAEPNAALWDVFALLPRLTTDETLYVYELKILETLGMLPDSTELERFFMPDIHVFLKGAFPLGSKEQKKIEEGIRKILILNHMV